MINVLPDGVTGIFRNQIIRREVSEILEYLSIQLDHSGLTYMNNVGPSSHHLIQFVLSLKHLPVPGDPREIFESLTLAGGSPFISL